MQLLQKVWLQLTALNQGSLRTYLVASFRQIAHLYLVGVLLLYVLLGARGASGSFGFATRWGGAARGADAPPELGELVELDELDDESIRRAATPADGAGGPLVPPAAPSAGGPMGVSTVAWKRSPVSKL